MSAFKFITSKTFFKHLGLALLVLFLVMILSFMSLSYYTDHGESISVPDVKGLTPEQIADQYGDKNLEFVVQDSAFVVSKKPKEVIEQDPKPNSKVKEHRTIYLTINATNPPKVKMPNLIDVSLKQATMILESMGLKMGKTIYKPDLAHDAVLDQLINSKPVAPGTTIRKGMYVDLVVGDGLGETQVVIPNLSGLTLEEAKFVLQGSNLNLGAIVYDKTFADTAFAVVYKQIPDFIDGQTIKMGEPVDVFLGAPPIE